MPSRSTGAASTTTVTAADSTTGKGQPCVKTRGCFCYNLRELFNLPESRKLLAEMPFGGIAEERESKAKEKIEERVKFYR